MKALVRFRELFFRTPVVQTCLLPVVLHLMFNGEHYHIWAVKMRFHLRSLGFWNVVISEADPSPLGTNPTVAQKKAHEEEKLKKDKAITYLHSGLADHVFTKIMNLETSKLV